MITVVGEHAGREVVSFALAHGEDPVAGLRARGWQAQVEAVEGVLGDLTFRYAVVPTEDGSANDPAGPEGPGLSRAERVHIVPHQRVAASRALERCQWMLPKSSRSMTMVAARCRRMTARQAPTRRTSYRAERE